MKKKLRFLIASGPTREPLDPVRYLSNYSTGTMGKCLASAAKEKGHTVTSIDCPAKAETAVDLQKELKRLVPKNDVLIMAAAVCDVRPHRISGIKIKKEALSKIQLTKNPDILASLSKFKRKDQVFIGFALESKNIFRNARRKQQQKKLDLIILNKVTKNKKPFGDRPVKAFFLGKDEAIVRLGILKKQKLAALIIRKAEEFIRLKNSP